MGVPSRTEARERAVPRENLPLVRLAIVVGVGADDHVADPVAVDVAGGADGTAEARTRLVALRPPVGVGGRPRLSEPARRAVPHEDLALVGLAVVVERRPDDDVRVAVAVHVARRAHRDAEVRRAWLLCADQSALDGTPVAPSPVTRAVPDERRAFVGLGLGEAARADDDVVVTVAVDVPRRGHRVAHARLGVVARRGPVRHARRTVVRAVVDEDLPLVRLPVVEEHRADDDLGVAVAVDVSGRGHRVAELRAGLVPFVVPDPRRRQSRGTAEERLGPSEPFGVVWRARQHVAEAVAVDVPRGRDRPAVVVRLGRARDRPVRRRRRAARAAVEDLGLAALHVRRRVVRCADDDVRVVVAVDVARRPDGPAVVRVRLPADARPERCRAETRGTAGEDHDLAFLGERDRPPRRADDHVGEPVAVHVARGADRGAGAGLRARRPVGVVGLARRPESRRRSVPDVDLRRVAVPHDDVGVSVAVDVARGAHGRTESLLTRVPGGCGSSRSN